MAEQREPSASRRAPQEYFGQFLLSRSSTAAAPQTWARRTCNGWHLATHPGVPVLNLQSRDGQTLGWIIGHAIDAEGAVARGAMTLSAFATSADFRSDLFESELYRHGGRYVCAVVTPFIQHFYVDPGGMLAAVYSPQRERIGSTNTILHLDEADAYAQRKNAEQPLPANHFYPAGLTGDPGVYRVLPNHRLDLSAWKATRHWPAAPLGYATAEEVPALVARIVDRTRALIAAATREQLAYMGLTAGRDSRMVLAAARGVIDRVDFLTFDYPDPDKRADVHMASKLARLFHLRHRVIPLARPTDEDRLRYLNAIGYAGSPGKARDFDGSLNAHTQRDRAWLTGYGGEVARGFYWRPTDRPGDALDAAELLQRMQMPRPDFLDAMEVWRLGTGLRDDPFALLDLTYLEQRLGCWAAAHEYGTAPFVMQLTAFNHRDVWEAMLRLPPERKGKQPFADAVISHAWPELGAFPYQQYTGMRMFAERVKKKLVHIRKRLSGAAGQHRRR
jgi:hypothetical protein